MGHWFVTHQSLVFLGGGMILALCVVFGVFDLRRMAREDSDPALSVVIPVFALLLGLGLIVAEVYTGFPVH